MILISKNESKKLLEKLLDNIIQIPKYEIDLNIFIKIYGKESKELKEINILIDDIDFIPDNRQITDIIDYERNKSNNIILYIQKCIDLIKNEMNKND